MCDLECVACGRTASYADASIADSLRSCPGDDRDDTVSVGEIVTSDKALIDKSDAILVGYTAVRSIGTPMEVMYAYDRDIPTALWIRDGTDSEDLSPWYRHHVTGVFDALRPALGHLRQEVAADA